MDSNSYPLIGLRSFNSLFQCASRANICVLCGCRSQAEARVLAKQILHLLNFGAEKRHEETDHLDTSNTTFLLVQEQSKNLKDVVTNKLVKAIKFLHRPVIIHCFNSLTKTLYKNVNQFDFKWFWKNQGFRFGSSFQN